MGAAPNSIATIPVSIVGDYSDLAGAFSEAVDQATNAGSQIADAIGSGAESAGEGVDALTGNLGELSTNTEAAGSSAEETGATLNQLGEHAGEAAPQVQQLAESEREAGEAGESAASQIRELLTSFAEFAGIGLGVEALKEFASECLTTYANVEEVTIALTGMTGSAQTAGQMIEFLKTLAQSDALSFPSLLPAAQRMIAMGFSAQQTAEMLQAAGDMSKAAGLGFDALTQAEMRLSESSTVNNRMLQRMGITAGDLASALGVTSGELAETWKNMDDNGRIQAIVTSLERMHDTATKVAQDTKSQWTLFKNSWDELMEDIGGAIAPAITSIVQFGVQLIQLTEGGQRAITSLKELGLEFASVVAAMHGDTAGAAQAAMAAAQLEVKFQNTQKTAAQLAAELSNVRNAHSGATAAATAHAEAVGKLQLALQDFHSPLELMTTELKSSTDAVDANLKAIGDLSTGNLLAQGSLNRVTEAYRAGTATYDQYTKAVADAAKVQKELNAAVGSAPILQPAPIQASAVAMSALVGQMKALPPYVDTLQNIDEWWTKQSAHIAKLAKTDMPAAVAMYDEYIARLQASNGPLGQIYSAQEKELALEIQMATNRGQDATQLMLQLAAIKQKQDDLTQSAQRIGQMYNTVMQQGVADFQKLGQSIATNITQGKTLAAAFTTAIKSIGSEIMSELVGYAFKQLGQAIMNTASGPLKSLLSSWGSANTTMQTQSAASYHSMQATAQTTFTAIQTKATASLQAVATEGQTTATSMSTAFTTMSTTVSTAFATMETSIAASLTAAQATFFASNVADVMSDAAVAYAATYASISAIPIIGPGMAPAAAEASYAAVAAEAPMASFDAGGYVPEDMMAMVHAGEYIVPANAAGMSGSQSGAGGPGGGQFFLLQNCTLHASDVNGLMNQMVKAARRVGARL